MNGWSAGDGDADFPSVPALNGPARIRSPPQVRLSAPLVWHMKFRREIEVVIPASFVCEVGWRTGKKDIPSAVRRKELRHGHSGRRRPCRMLRRPATLKMGIRIPEGLGFQPRRKHFSPAFPGLIFQSSEESLSEANPLRARRFVTFAPQEDGRIPLFPGRCYIVFSAWLLAYFVPQPSTGSMTFLGLHCA